MSEGPDDRPDDHGPGEDDPGPDPGGPPHPMDRIWRHPSELPAFDRPASGPARNAGPARVRSVLAPLGAGAIGALVTVAVLAAVGVFDQNRVTSVSSRPTGGPRPANVVAAMAGRVAPAIVAVRVFAKSGSSRTGSGVCIRHAGQVLTSDRLIAGYKRIDVVTADGKVQTAKVIGHDASSDLALLAISGGVEAADLAESGSVRFGDAVYAVGSDSSGAPWVSEGIVSSVKGRVAIKGSTTMGGLIESNALTEPATAGGALLDADGRVAGILMTPVKSHPAAIAVPITFASQVADALRANGRVDHGWLGLAGRVTSKGGFLVTALAERGPSEKSGIRRGDTIVTADSMPIATMGELMATARRHWPGERIRLKVKRGRDLLTISVRLARMPRIEEPSTSTTSAATPSTTAVPSTTVSTRP